MNPELFEHLAFGPHPGRFIRLHDAAGQLPIVLVGGFDQQDAPGLIAEQHMPDDAMSGQHRVHHAAESVRPVDLIDGQPGVDQHVAPATIGPAHRLATASLATKTRTMQRAHGHLIIGRYLHFQAFDPASDQCVVGGQADPAIQGRLISLARPLEDADAVVDGQLDLERVIQRLRPQPS